MVTVWDKEAENYSSNADITPDYLAHFIEVEKAVNPKNKKILEIGSGTGITSAYLAKKGGDLYLVDISETALNFSKKYFQSRNLKAKYFKQDAFSLNFPQESFDVVWNGGLIEHFKDEKKIQLIRTMWGLVKKGGIILITVPNSFDLPFMTAKKILRFRRRWAFGYEDDLNIFRLKGLAKKAGITDFKIYAYNPAVSWWFFPYGKEICQKLGLNRVKYHQIRVLWGHNLVFRAQK